MKNDLKKIQHNPREISYDSNHLKTILEGDYAFRVRKDGQAQFDWFRGAYDGSGIPDVEILEIPDQIQEYPVTMVNLSLSKKHPSIKSIKLPSSIRDMEGENPFSCCPNLQEFILSRDHPTFRTENGLLICRETKQVVCCPRGSGIRTALIPPGINSIAEDAFADCYSLERVTMDDDVTELGQGAFYRCRNLKEIRLSKGIREIPDYLFQECFQLGAIELPEGLTQIGSMSFSSCYKLTSLKIPDSVESFGFYTFLDCKNLKEINLPSSLREIDMAPFPECDHLTTISIPKNHPYYRLEDGLLIDLKRQEVIWCFPNLSKAQVNIPAGVKAIGEFVFDGNKVIREVRLPDGLESIGDGAFSNCPNLRTVIIPETVTTLGDFVFLGSDRLRRLSFPKHIAEFGTYTIMNAGYCKIMVHRHSAARDFCRTNHLPYHLIRRKR